MDWWSEKRRRRERRRKIMGAITAVIAAVALIIMTIAPSFADTRGYNEFDVHATADADGRIEVSIDVEYSFGSGSGRGILLAFVTRQAIENDPDHWRLIRYSNVRAHSDTAPADVRLEEEADGIGIYIGDPDVTISGTHTYRVSFTVEGITNLAVGENGEDEIYWNVISAAENEGINNITVMLEAPAEPIEVGCWVGKFSDQTPCVTGAPGSSSATFVGENLRGGAGLTIAASYPPGTFPGGGPILGERTTFASVMGGWWTAIGAGLASILACVVTPLGYRLFRRDQRYVGVTPGLMPAGESDVRVGPAPVRLDAPVQFTPPPGLTPVEVGLLLEQKVTPGHITATIVDLAVRGYLKIEVTGAKKRKSNWEITRKTEDTDGLKAHEKSLLSALFDAAGSVHLDSLRASQWRRIDSLMRREEMSLPRRGWYVKSLKSAQTRAVFFGIGISLLGVVIMVTLALTAGFALLATPLIIAGIAIMSCSGRAAQRSPEAYALYVHTLGFKKYLETAEASQLQFEVDEDIFSRYLPYAMVFKVVENWVAVFEQLAANGQWEIEPTWYSAHAPNPYLFASLNASGAFAANLRTASTVAWVGTSTASTTGSSGGSAFSGGSSGGGYSGGGVGGGSAGSW